MTTDSAVAVGEAGDAVKAPWASVAELVWSALSKRKRLCAAIIGIQLLAMVAVLSQPALNARIVDSGAIAGDIGYIERTGLVMIVIVAVGACASILAVALGSRLAVEAAADLRSRMFRQTARMDADEYRKFGTPTLLTRSTVDANIVGQAVFAFAATAVTAPLVTLGAVVQSFRQSWRLTPVIAVTAIALVAVIGVFVVTVTPLAVRHQRAIDRLNLLLREQLVGIRVIRLFRRERLVGERFGEANDGLTRLARRVGAAQALLFPAALAITNLAVAFTTMWAADLIDANQMTIGDLTAFSGYLSLVVSGLVLFLPMITLWPRARASADRIRDVLTAAQADPGGAVAPLIRGPRAIELDDVVVRYPGAAQPSLRSVSLMCPPGGVTGVIGGTSSGKTTLANAVVRLVDIESGTLRIGGHSVTELPLSKIRREVTLVGGGQQLVAGTVRSNLALADPSASDERLWHALDAARMGLALRTREGLDTQVSQGGANFSGGQRQRLALARAIVRQPRVLILDDALSAMDRPTADAVLGGLRRMLPMTTLVVTSQQVSTVRAAHRIVVLDGGEVVDAGTHDELSLRCDVYRELAVAQGHHARERVR